jgi:hypothetical protein
MRTTLRPRQPVLAGHLVGVGSHVAGNVVEQDFSFHLKTGKFGCFPMLSRFRARIGFDRFVSLIHALLIRWRQRMGRESARTGPLWPLDGQRAHRKAILPRARPNWRDHMHRRRNPLSPAFSQAAMLACSSFPANSNHIRSHTEALGSSTQIRSCVSLWYCAYRVTAKSTSRIARTIQMLLRIKALLWS